MYHTDTLTEDELVHESLQETIDAIKEIELGRIELEKLKLEKN